MNPQESRCRLPFSVGRRRVQLVVALGLVLCGLACSGQRQRPKPAMAARDGNAAGERPVEATPRETSAAVKPTVAPRETPAVVALTAAPPVRAESSVAPVPSSPVASQAKLAALAERAEFRAFFGAPPVIPHEIAEFDSEAVCLTCHGADADEAAPKIPHAHLASCTQCHVVAELELFTELDLPPNSFAGLAEPVSGRRACRGAPPVIPHSIHMRERCLGCHGSGGRAGMQSSHPERQSCLQCHATTAALNQRFVGQPAVFFPPPFIENR